MLRNKTASNASDKWASSDEIIAYGWAKKRGDVFSLSWPRRFLVASRKGITYYMDTVAAQKLAAVDPAGGEAAAAAAEPAAAAAPASAEASETPSGTAGEGGGEAAATGDGEAAGGGGDASAAATAGAAAPGGEVDGATAQGGAEAAGEGEVVVEVQGAQEGAQEAEATAERAGARGFAAITAVHGVNATPTSGSPGVGADAPSKDAVLRLFSKDEDVRGRVAVEDMTDVVVGFDGVKAHVEVRLKDAAGAWLRLDFGTDGAALEWARVFRFMMQEHRSRAAPLPSDAELGAAPVSTSDDDAPAAGAAGGGGGATAAAAPTSPSGGSGASGGGGRFMTKQPSIRSGPARRERVEIDRSLQPVNEDESDGKEERKEPEAAADGEAEAEGEGEGEAAIAEPAVAAPPLADVAAAVPDPAELADTPHLPQDARAAAVPASPRLPASVPASSVPPAPPKNAPATPAGAAPAHPQPPAQSQRTSCCTVA